MAFLGGNIQPLEMDSNKLIFTGLGTLLCLGIGLSRLLNKQGPKTGDQSPGILQAFGLFFYTCFVKPHRVGGTNTQQDALESFYETQASIYDVTRTTLLKGREDMLALAAAQLLHRAKKQSHQKRIWVDVRRTACHSSNHVGILLWSRSRLLTPTLNIDRWWHWLEHRSNEPLR